MKPIRQFFAVCIGTVALSLLAIGFLWIAAAGVIAGLAKWFAE